MDTPEIYKDIEVNGRKFRLNKMDARTGSYMLFKLTKLITPIIKNIEIEKLESMELGNVNLTELADSLFDLPEKEFRYIQDNCLKVVEEILKAGPQKILNNYGVWGVENIEYDIVLVMNLTVQSLVFNVKGFFNANLLDSITKRLTTFQLN